MAFKHWPLVRDVRFTQKCGRYLRGARKRRPDLGWDEFLRVARHFKQDDMGSFPERGFLFLKAANITLDRKVLSDLAIRDEVAFNALVKQAQDALKAKAAAPKA